MSKNAIISVYDKKDLDIISKYLIKKNYTIYSTGGTSDFLKKNNIPHIEISKYTKQKEILGGRVKTLHPKIFGGLLGTKSDNHQKELQSEKIVNFDILIVNLYPFQETIKNTTKTNEIIEMIDIGGHSLIRAAIKNYAKTIPVVSPNDYPQIIRKIPKSNLERKKYAIKALQHVTEYDIAIANWFQGIKTEEYPLRYGENPQQKAVALVNDKSFVQLSGEKRLSYNNLLDLDAAINIAYNTSSKENICTIVKHNIPCGGAITKNQKNSYLKALAGDPLSAFGGIVTFNQKLTAVTAKLIVKNFYEVIAAPDFENEAIKILQVKKNLRVLKVKKFKTQTEQRSIFAGALIQDSNSKTSQIKSIYGKSKLNKDKLNFFVNILKYIKSNAIALFDNDSLVSQSGGQTSRVDALQNCFYKLKLKHDYKKFKNLSLFSDAFFPFTDSLEFIKKEKMKVSIFAPMGSQNDEKIEFFAKKNKLNFFKLSDRHFKH
ncbi:bifunctional phosphoribosylaminoimidazolecarboxamide formyltransferase/IMP cyclohydrolase [Alphaproteobacteria bacterium]|nr:bifunctional phosphoribosylaminoimidazolecarboxamide formyltransferase/IMP cyclohydrolase [Alphaproteobacteria bacterium]